MLADMISWLTDPANWRGDEGVLAQLLLHLYYCGLSVGVAVVIAVPVGLYVGHTGRGGVLVVGATNAMRALPTLGLVTLLVLVFGLGLVPPLAGLVVLAVPAILSGTYAGIHSVPGEVVDAAKGTGMSQWQRLWQVEVPNALPLMMGGLRNAMLQVVATVAVAAYVGLGGLGEILLAGQATYDYPQMVSAALLIALLAVVLDFALAGITRWVVPEGLVLAAGDTRKSGRNRRRG